MVSHLRSRMGLPDHVPANAPARSRQRYRDAIREYLDVRPFGDEARSVARPGLCKFVVSGTLEGPLRWNNATLIGGGLAEEIAELKRQRGKDVTILGSGELVRTLLGYGLLDELRLMIYLVILGGGERLFGDGQVGTNLELVDSRTFASGVVCLTYRSSATERPR
ncbi:RibD C-terminal domain (plasmid) [Rubrobacter radiotolerans]|uniref:RibD C-terminal domain n=1 Tax=Rubrobacter radiotolerans TaxID=42256 RepID=A0A023X7G3_RUBRA|nr:RibD C-terminal domain [Rubrobacter radiotolerans]SMC01777.1 RibD C-terminal domain-containing protein [Rubrobacter radiotolerans DSM 5868]